MAGLDPAIHLPKENSFLTDARVKPAHDVSWGGAAMI
jgi:hypothetical protein